MKKGLLSILAGALLVVGCQNYDDQFSALETQINALASTVAGLSQVQSDLSSLSGTVASLASTVNGLGSQIDTAVADGLSDIQADITAIEAAVADVASSEEVASLQSAVDSSQDDLDQLLANSSVFNNSIVINSESTANLYAAMGSAINIVNGDVTIDVSADMTQATVQTVVDNILNIVGDLSYTAAASTIAETTFNNLSGVESITAKQGGGYEFKALTSATNVVLNNDYKSTVDIIHFGALTSVTTISDDGGTAGTIAFDKATEFHLTSLTRYPGNNLNIEIDKGGVLAMGALTDNDATGKAVGSGYSLTVKGPASLDISKISDGTITAEDVASLTVSNFIGNLDVNSGVETLNGTGIVDMALDGGVDLETVTISGALDSDIALTTADAAGPDVTFTSVHTDLTTVSLSGVLGAISVTSASNLESLTVSADLNGSSLTATGNNDLVTVNVNGAKVGDVTIQNNTDLETLTLDHTTDLATADTGATVSITGNTNMTSLTFKADDVDSLTVTGNTQLTTVDFTDLKDLGTSTTATVAISNNKLTATSSKDAYDTAPTTSDTGTYASTSGMATLETYLTAAMAATGARTIGVYFDTIEQAQSQASATAAYADDTHTDAVTGTGVNAVAYAVTTASSGTDVSQAISYVFRAKVNVLYGYPALGSGEGVTMTLVQGAAQVSTEHKQSATGNTTVDQLIASMNADTTLGSNISLTAARDSYAESYNLISYTDSAGAAETTATADSNNGKTVLWSLGTVTGTAVLGSNSTTAQIATAVAAAMTGTVVDGVGYGAVGSGNAIVLNRVVSNTTNVDLGKNTSAFPTIAFDLGNATFTTVDFATGVNTNSTGVNSDFYLNVTGTDVNGLRVTVTNNSTAVALSVTSITTVGTAGAFDEAGSTAVATLLASGTNMEHNPAVVSAFADISSATAASTATKNRISWLG